MTIHAHKLTPDDCQIIRELTGSQLCEEGTFVLPSGLRTNGRELQQWVEPAFVPDPDTLRWVASELRRYLSLQSIITADQVLSAQVVEGIARDLVFGADKRDPSVVDKLAAEIRESAP